MLVGDVGELYLSICIGTGGYYIPAVGDKEVAQRGDDLVRNEHHAGERLTDNAVQRYQDGERDKGPDAAAHGVDALFTVQLLHLLIEFLGIALMASLQLLYLRLDTGSAHHALLALCHEGEHDEVYEKREEDYGKTVVSGHFINLQQRP